MSNHFDLAWNILDLLVVAFLRCIVAETFMVFMGNSPYYNRSLATGLEKPKDYALP